MHASSAGMSMSNHENFYDLLEVDPQAARSEIVQAYHRAKAAFAPDSLATYTLYTPDEARAIAARIETAFRVLVDARKRAQYDRWLDQTKAGEEVPLPDFLLPPPAQPAVAEPEPSPAQAAPAPSEPAETGGEERVTEILQSTDSFDGTLLRKVREARGLSIEQISSSTKISPMNLRFIEENNYASLPAAVYLRGFLQQVARCLKIPADRVVEGYMRRVEQWRASGV